MPKFATFCDGIDEKVDTLVITLVNPGSDAGRVTRLVDMSLSGLDEKAAVRFNVDPLVDYRSSRPMVHFSKGRLVGMGREDVIVSLSRDVTGSPYLRMHGIEPDFHWDSLVSDMFDIVEHFGVRRVFCLTAVGAPVPHTRPVDMIVRTTGRAEGPILDADFWFPASFGSYFEFHAGKMGIDVTSIAVRVPIYLGPHHYPSGAASALSMASKLSGLSFPVGDLTRDAEEQKAELAQMVKSNPDFAEIVGSFEEDYDEKDGDEGFVQAPEADFFVPTVEEIGKAAERFLQQASEANGGPAPSLTASFDPQGLLSRIERYRESQGMTHSETFAAPGQAVAPEARETRGDAQEGSDRSGEASAPQVPARRRRRGRHLRED